MKFVVYVLTFVVLISLTKQCKEKCVIKPSKEPCNVYGECNKTLNNCYTNMYKGAIGCYPQCAGIGGFECPKGLECCFYYDDSYHTTPPEGTADFGGICL